MLEPDLPPNEQSRLQALIDLRILDTPPEAEFDAIVRLAAHLLDTPISVVTMIDCNRQWFKAKYGLDTAETPRAISFCGHCVASGKPLIVSDATADSRFADNPLVEGAPHIRAYAGHPLFDEDGHCLGTLAVIDRRIRPFTPQQLGWLAAIAATVNAHLSLRQAGHRLQQLSANQSSLLAALPGLYFVLDPHQRIQEVHGADRASLIAKPADFLGKTVLECLPPPAGPQISAAIDRARASGRMEIVNYELMVGTQPAHFQARIATPQQNTIVVYVQNTTANELTLRRLETTNKLLELVVDSQSRALTRADYPLQLNRILGELMAYTESSFGLLGEIEEGQDNLFSFRPYTVRRGLGESTPSSAATGMARTEPVPLDLAASLLSEAISRHHTLVFNPGHPQVGQIELPVEHPAFTSLLVIPIRTGQSALNLLVLANRGREYDSSLLSNLQPMLHTIGSILELASSRLRHNAAEKALEEKEFQYQRIVELAQEGIWMIDPEGQTTFANSRMAQILGTTVSNLMGRPVLDFIFPEDQSAALSQLARRRQGINDQFDFRFRRVDGREVHCALQTASLMNAERVYLGAMAMVMDVTYRRSSEQAVQEGDRRYEGIIESASDAIITIDTAGTIEQINPAASRHLGYQPGELLGQNVRLLMPPPDRERHDSYLANYLTTGVRKITGIGREVTVVRKDGSHYPAELSVNEFTVRGKTYYTGIIRDISDRKRVERLQAEFIATVSHELRTPLTGIRGALGLIAGGAAGPLTPDIAGYIDIALSNSETLIRLVNEILEAERLQEGSLEFFLKTVSSGAAVEQACRANQSFAASNQVQLNPATGELTACLQADPDRLIQVLNNLLSNAIKHAPPGSSVDVEIAAQPNTVRISVLDRGPGVGPSFRDRLFSRFTQEDSSTTRKHVGTGLGLSIAKAIVERMNGAIGFQPREGGGACFWFELPAAAPGVPEA